MWTRPRRPPPRPCRTSMAPPRLRRHNGQREPVKHAPKMRMPRLHAGSGWSAMAGRVSRAVLAAVDVRILWARWVHGPCYMRAERCGERSVAATTDVCRVASDRRREGHRGFLADRAALCSPEPVPEEDL